jgi:hypothetical protein
MMVEYQVTVVKGKNYTARIRKPILSEEERKLREEAVKKVLVQFYIETRGKQYV